MYCKRYKKAVENASDGQLIHDTDTCFARGHAPPVLMFYDAAIGVFERRSKTRLKEVRLVLSRQLLSTLHLGVIVPVVALRVRVRVLAIVPVAEIAPVGVVLKL